MAAIWDFSSISRSRRLPAFSKSWALQGEKDHEEGGWAVRGVHSWLTGWPAAPSVPREAQQ